MSRKVARNKKFKKGIPTQAILPDHETRKAHRISRKSRRNGKILAQISMGK